MKKNNLNITDTDKNTKVLKKYKEIWNGIKDCTEKINDNKFGEYNKGFMKIKFIPNDDIPLNKVLYIPNAIVVIRSIFEKDGKYYPQMFLMNLCIKYKNCHNMKELIFQRELILISQINQSNV